MPAGKGMDEKFVVRDLSRRGACGVSFAGGTAAGHRRSGVTRDDISLKHAE